MPSEVNLDRRYPAGLIILTVLVIGMSLSMKGSGVSPKTDQAERVFPLPELARPGGIVAAKGRVFILDARDVLVYDLDNGRFLTRIGRLGQGPGEFPWGPRWAFFRDGRLYVESSASRVECFDAKGVYIQTLHEPDSAGFFPYLPVGRNFVAFPLFRDADGGLMPPTGCIYDARLKRLRKGFAELPAMPPAPPPPGVAETGSTDYPLIRDFGDFVVEGARIYVADSRRGFSISIFNENGNLLQEIRHPFDKVKVPKSFVQDVLREWKASKEWASSFSHRKPVVPEYFPAILGLKADGGRIYGVTSAAKDGQYEVIVMDTDGRILAREFRFPLHPNFEMPFMMSRRYDIQDGKIVWCAYNDKAEVYELHIR
jgi:hypothetical protein